MHALPLQKTPQPSYWQCGRHGVGIQCQSHARPICGVQLLGPSMRFLDIIGWHGFASLAISGLWHEFYAFRGCATSTLHRIVSLGGRRLAGRDGSLVGPGILQMVKDPWRLDPWELLIVGYLGPSGLNLKPYMTEPLRLGPQIPSIT